MSEYSDFDVKQLWQMVDAARQGLQPSHDQVAALNNAQQMLSGHAQSLEEARDQLATKWPPETNAASAAYLSELDRLIAAVRDTALSCAVNVFHINTVSDAIIQAHDKLTPLHVEFIKNEGALAQYNAEIEAFSDGASAVPGGSTAARGVAKLFTSPPVDDSRQDELTRQAQQAMMPLASAAQDGATYIKPPAPYTPPAVDLSYGGDDLKQIGNSGGSDAASPPRVSPPAYTRVSADAPTTQDSNKPEVPPNTGHSGPVLSGYAPTPVQPVQNLTPPIGPGIVAGNPIGPISGPIPGFGTATGGYVGRLPNALAPGVVGRGRSFGSTNPLRGGVIGNVPVGTGGSSHSRVNPVGSVIGQQPRADGRATSSGRTAHGNNTGAMAPQTSRQRRGATEAGSERWDPNNPWEVQEGVDPVILPDPSPGRVDPGPGIIGIDR